MESEFDYQPILTVILFFGIPMFGPYVWRWFVGLFSRRRASPLSD